MKTCYVLYIVLTTSFATCSKIVFPTSHASRTDTCFLSQHNKSGKCVRPQDCALYEALAEQNRYGDILCKPGSVNHICCPDSLDPIIIQEPKPTLDISRPTSALEKCGSTFDQGFADLPQFYSANITADELAQQGFQITEHLVFGDKLVDFRYSNLTYNSTYIDVIEYERQVFGGIDARRIVTVYTALLGKRGNTIEWLCDGALINFEWILTAAHCFVREIDIVRLGEYDLTTTKPSSSEDPQDYGITKIIIYPKYKFPAAYHDLALVQLSRRAYVSRPDINPVCLPWGTESNISLLNRQIILTGWGATFFGGPIANIAQEVNVTALDIAKCEKGYSTLRDYTEKFPSGLRSNNILCAGDEDGGKDACQGDSGGPVVYLNNDRRYTLAGIVSTGHGCGQKEFPGIYTKIAVPEYLNWIKATAFSTYVPPLLR